MRIPKPNNRSAALLATGCVWLAALPVAYVAVNWIDIRLAVKLFWIDCLVLLIIAPCLEELVFRLGLQQPLCAYLHHHLKPPLSDRTAVALSIAIAALAFGLAHAFRLGGIFNLQWLVWCIPGIALALVWHWHGSVSTNIATHAWFNLALLAVDRLS